MNGLVIHSILEFPFCLIKSTGSTFGYLTGERRLPGGKRIFLLLGYEVGRIGELFELNRSFMEAV